MERVTNLFSQLQGGSCTVDGSAVNMSNPLTEFVNRWLGTPGARSCSLPESKKRVSRVVNEMEKDLIDSKKGLSSWSDELEIRRIQLKEWQKMTEAWEDSQKKIQTKKSKDKTRNKKLQQSKETKILLEKYIEKINDYTEFSPFDYYDTIDDVEPPRGWKGEWNELFGEAINAVNHMINGDLDIDHDFLRTLNDFIYNYEISFDPDAYPNGNLEELDNLNLEINHIIMDLLYRSKM